MTRMSIERSWNFVAKISKSLVVRFLLNVSVIFVQGYQGMVDGGDCIQEAQWKTVSNIIQKVMFISFFLR